jgi:hypothetical protein
MDMDRQPNYVTIACVLAVLYLVVKNLQFSKEISTLSNGLDWIFVNGGFAAQLQQPPPQQTPRRRAPEGYEGPRGRNDDSGPIRDRSERRSERPDRPVQDRGRGKAPDDQDFESMIDDQRFVNPGKGRSK